MLRTDLQNIAKIRLKEAHLLLKEGHYSGAYYLSGYVMECALKSCIARKTAKHQFPDKDHAYKCYTHDLSQLLKIAGIDGQLKIHGGRAGNENFLVNWVLVKDWSENCRYLTKTEQEAKDIYSAITSRKNGVLIWVKRYW